MGSVFLRNDIGIPSESFFAKMERFFIKLASAKLQHEKADSKFFANLWRFEMLKSAHFTSVYGEKIIFCIARVYVFQNVTFWKSDTPCNFND